MQRPGALHASAANGLWMSAARILPHTLGLLFLSRAVLTPRSTLQKCAGSSTYPFGKHFVLACRPCQHYKRPVLLCRRTAALTDQPTAVSTPAAADIPCMGSPVRAADSAVGGDAVAQRPPGGSPTQPSSLCGAAPGDSRASFAGSIDVGVAHSPHAATEPDLAAPAPEPDSAQLCTHTSPAAVPAEEPACAAAAERAGRASMPGPWASAAAPAADKSCAGSESLSMGAPTAPRCAAAPPAKGHAKPVLAPAAVQGRWRARGAAGAMQPGCQGPASSPGADQRSGVCSNASAHQQQLEHCGGMSRPAEGRRATRIPSCCRSSDPAERRAASSSPTEGQRASRIPSCRSSGHAEDASSSPGADPPRALDRRGGSWRPQSAGVGGPGRVQRAASCWEGRLAANLG